MDISISAIFAQLINFGILFFIFNRFLAKPISKSIEDRRILINKLEKVNEMYDQKIRDAEEKAKDILLEGLKKKDQIIAEAGVMADKRKMDIISEAKNKAEEIIKDSKLKSDNMEAELKANFVNGVKNTSFLVLKKLFKKDQNLESKYFDEVLDEVTSNK